MILSTRQTTIDLSVRRDARVDRDALCVVHLVLRFGFPRPPCGFSLMNRLIFATSAADQSRTCVFAIGRRTTRPLGIRPARIQRYTESRPTLRSFASSTVE